MKGKTKTKKTTTVIARGPTAKKAVVDPNDERLRDRTEKGGFLTRVGETVAVEPMDMERLKGNQDYINALAARHQATTRRGDVYNKYMQAYLNGFDFFRKTIKERSLYRLIVDRLMGRI